MAPKISFLRMAFASAVFFFLSVGFSTGTPVPGHLSVTATVASKVTAVQPEARRAAEAPGETATEEHERVPHTVPEASTPQVATPAPVPPFEVASVKPCAPGDGAGRAPGQRGGLGGGGGQYMTPSPGRLYVNCMSVFAMMNQYLMMSDADHLLNDSPEPIDPRRVRGGPAWVYSDRYTIDTKTSAPAAAGPTEGQSATAKLLMGPMLRLLLEDRFQLKTHRDSEELPMYSLTVAKGGLKLKPMEEGGCVPPDLDNGRLPWEAPGPGQKPLCLEHTGWIETDWTIRGGGQKMSALAEALSVVTDHHVIDKTGLSDLFNYSLRFAHDDTTPGDFQPGMRSPFSQSDVPAGPSVFTVLEEQLGLKLVPDKGPRGYLVIDHVERPSEN